MGIFRGVDFRELLERHRRELHVHCYRMLASFEEADDAVQETFLRAWRHRDGFEPGTNPRAWLYRIATNTCLDTIRRSSRRPPSASAEVAWLQPYPDTLLDQVAPPGEQPDAARARRRRVPCVQARRPAADRRQGRRVHHLRREAFSAVRASGGTARVMTSSPVAAAATS
ncbi:hypothetical protein GCM10010399_88680 [Dactylosporangium fulvum]|uniref:sigma-70 family RNA polymerase sigma factor n=1 Tax=Dactylosporangium fulvum TaxID=53359 RepID=UPI003375702A